MRGMIKRIAGEPSGVCPGGTMGGPVGATPFLNRMPEGQGSRSWAAEATSGRARADQQMPAQVLSTSRPEGTRRLAPGNRA
jgi:hypothetical protein